MDPVCVGLLALLIRRVLSTEAYGTAAAAWNCISAAETELGGKCSISLASI